MTPLDSVTNLDELVRPEAAYCFVTASRRYNLPPESLLSLAMVEGGKVGTTSRNTNGTHDLGVMQVNTLWLKPNSPLQAYVDQRALVNDRCTNIHAAAWILADNLVKARGDIWRAVGMYHHPSNDSLAQRYIQKVNHVLPVARQVLLTVPEYRRYLDAFYRAP